jgi:hypothetical protein
MKLVVFGSRTIEADRGIIELGAAVGSRLSSITEVVSGKAIGADTIGEIWAKTHNIPIAEYPPNKKHGFLAALFIRNDKMAEYCDIGIALWDGQSNGTRHMMKCMQKYGKPFDIVIIGPKEVEPLGLEKFFDDDN